MAREIIEVRYMAVRGVNTKPAGSSATSPRSIAPAPTETPEQRAKRIEQEAAAKEARAKQLEAERMRDYKTGQKVGSDVTRQFTSVVDPAIRSGKNAAFYYSPDQTFRDYQVGLANQLAAQARGEGPSLAQMQLAQATDRTLQQSLGMARSALGSNPALAARTAALQASGVMGNAASQSAMLRLQEQQAAQKALAGLSESGRGMDIDTADQRALLGMDAARLEAGLLRDAAQNGAAISRDAFNNRQDAELDYMRAAQERQKLRDQRNQKYEDAGTKAGTDFFASKLGMYKGGLVPSPKKYACGGKVKMSNGGVVPSPKDRLPNDRQVKLKSGDHPDNDIIPAMLSPGEIIIPRSKAKDPKAAAKFAEAIAKRAKKEA